jgi:hypothetical protein
LCLEKVLTPEYIIAAVFLAATVATEKYATYSYLAESIESQYYTPISESIFIRIESTSSSLDSEYWII